MDTHRYIEQLNHPERSRRLQAVAQLSRELAAGRIARPPAGEDVNNHIHTFYSFSPYSPSKAVWMSFLAGLATAGIMDHDSISGAEEFIRGGATFGLATTVGVECRCDFSATPLKGRRINNPDQRSNAYLALHGVPHSQIGTVKEYFRPYQLARNARNRAMVARLNTVLPERELALDFDTEVLPLSMSHEGGSVTERHILFCLAQKMIARFGKGSVLLSFLEAKLTLPLNPGVRALLEDADNPHYAYDLLGALKSELVDSFYIAAVEECPGVQEFLNFSERIGAISAYAYLGDIAESVTGDKKSQKFEDDYLEELFAVLVDLGFRAVTYMPNRNSPQQLQRVQALCRKHSLFEISGVDINSPRQEFTCPEIRRPQFRHLIDSTWALIGHEREASRDLSRGMFHPALIRPHPSLQERIELFRRIGRQRSPGQSDT